MFVHIGSAVRVNADLALQGSGGSAYAQAHRNRILSDAIPAMTEPIGANAISRLAPSGQPNRNFNMQTNENGWPAGFRTGSETTSWHHSDIKVVAYTYTHKAFDQIATQGNLK